MEQQQNPLNEAVERDVRLLIGDLHMQLIVMRAMMNQQQQGQVNRVQPTGDANASTQRTTTQSDVRSSTGKINSGNSQEGGEGVRFGR